MERCRKADTTRCRAAREHLSRGSRRAGALAPPCNLAAPVRGRVPPKPPATPVQATTGNTPSRGSRRAGALAPPCNLPAPVRGRVPPKTTRHAGTHSPIFYIAIPIPHFSPNRHGLRTMPVFVGSFFPSFFAKKEVPAPAHVPRGTWAVSLCSHLAFPSCGSIYL